MPVEEPSPTTYDVCQKTVPFPTFATPATNLATNRPAPSKLPENENPRIRLSSLALFQPPPPPGQSQPTHPNPSTQYLTPITHWATPSVGSQPLSSPLSQNTSFVPRNGALEDSCSSLSNESLSLFRRTIPPPAHFASSPNLYMNPSPPFRPLENHIRLNTQPLLNPPLPTGMTEVEQPIASSEGSQLPPHPQHFPVFPPTGSWGNFSSPFSCDSSRTNISACAVPSSTLFSNPLYQTVDPPNFFNAKAACASAPCTGVQLTTHAHHVSFHPMQ